MARVHRVYQWPAALLDGRGRKMKTGGPAWPRGPGRHSGAYLFACGNAGRLSTAAIFSGRSSRLDGRRIDMAQRRYTRLAGVGRPFIYRRQSVCRCVRARARVCADRVRVVYTERGEFITRHSLATFFAFGRMRRRIFRRAKSHRGLSGRLSFRVICLHCLLFGHVRGRRNLGESLRPPLLEKIFSS